MAKIILANGRVTDRPGATACRVHVRQNRMDKEVSAHCSSTGLAPSCRTSLVYDSLRGPHASASSCNALWHMIELLQKHREMIPEFRMFGCEPIYSEVPCWC